MSEIFRKRILNLTYTDATRNLQANEMTFLRTLRLSLEAPTHPNGATISGAAFLFWVFGISNINDVQNIVTNILAEDTSTMSDKDLKDVIVRVLLTIDAIIKTFEEYGFAGKSREVQKDTDITPLLLAEWSLDSPLRHAENNYGLDGAMVSLLYEPLETVRDWKFDEKACQTYITLLKNLYGTNKEIDFSTTRSAFSLLKICVDKFGLSKSNEIEEVNVEETERHDPVVEEIDDFESDSASKVSKSRSKKSTSTTSRTTPMTSTPTSLPSRRSTPMKLRKENRTEQLAVLEKLSGCVYKALPGKRKGRRICVGWTDDFRIRTVIYSSWEKCLSNKCSKSMRDAWLKQFPDAPKDKNAIKEKLNNIVQMINKDFCEKEITKKLKILCVLCKMSTMSDITVLAEIESNEKWEKQIICTKNLIHSEWNRIYNQNIKTKDENFEFSKLKK